MTSYQVDILNPKAGKLLKDLAELNLISLSETSKDPFLAIVDNIRQKAIRKTPTLEEITKEVEIVRSKRYADKNKT